MISTWHAPSEGYLCGRNKRRRNRARVSRACVDRSVFFFFVFFLFFFFFFENSLTSNILGAMDIDVTEALAYIEEKRQHTGQRITITTLVIKATVRRERRKMKEQNAVDLSVYTQEHCGGHVT
jgi:hypothetical protein